MKTPHLTNKVEISISAYNSLTLVDSNVVMNDHIMYTLLKFTFAIHVQYSLHIGAYICAGVTKETFRRDFH